MINTIEYRNEEREEIITYYYSDKYPYGDMDLFFANISQLEKYSIEASSFKKLDIEIPIIELEHFFRDTKIEDRNIITFLNFEEDWNLINTFLETENYFILRIWSTTA